MSRSLTPQSSLRDSRLDAIRLVAFFLLITCHACDPFNAAATYGAGEANPDYTFWGAVWGSFVRPCVPLFVMLTGALLLGKKPANDASADMLKVYRRRIPRVLWPFLIWSAVYYLFPWILGLFGFGEGVVTSFFPWIETTDTAFAPAMQRIAAMPYNFSYAACHMWYVYMLIGLYLYLPVFDTWVCRATRRQKEAFLTLWAVSLFLPYLTEFVSHYNFGTCDWNAFGTFYYFAGFNGYLLLGHYLYRHLPRVFTRPLPWALPMFVAGYAVCLLGYRYILTLPNPTPSQVELFWTYCTPNVALMSVAIFIIFLSLGQPGEKLSRQLAHLTTCGFGIFMVHYLFVGPLFGLMAICRVPVALIVPLTALMVLGVTWIVVGTLNCLLGRKIGRVLLG